MTPPDIHKFLKDPHVRNKWLMSTYMSVYVRKGQHLIDGKFRSCFDVANINVPEEFRGQHIFTMWLERVEKKISEFGIECVFVESILENRLIPFLSRHGYMEVPGSNPPSMYKGTI